MRAGKLRHPIEVQAKSETKNSFGEPVENWAKVLGCRAGVEPLQGREYNAAQQTRSETTTRFRIRYPGMSITPDMRIVHDGRVFDISGVINPNERNRELHLMAVEQV